MTRQTPGISLVLCALAVVALSANGQRMPASPSNESHTTAAFYFSPHFHPGEVLGDITSRAISIHAEGVDDYVWRSGGTGFYTIRSSGPDGSVKWDSDVVMEGMFAEKGSGEFRNGGKTMCYKGDCTFDTSSSGLIYNPTFWGDMKGDLTPGQRWSVELKQPWENGPPGIQTVTVVWVDPANGITMLKREGTGDGPYDGDRKQVEIKRNGKTVNVNVTPGKAHWVGQAVFQKGIVVSDELISERPITYTSPEIGTIQGHERQYMTLTLLPME